MVHTFDNILHTGCVREDLENEFRRPSLFHTDMWKPRYMCAQCVICVARVAP